ncbi:serine/threonine protein kinase [Plasmodium falciparum IGH-CR14]|uniref:Serine/threonine protein kinase n=1 Tax=Plasmodium falciparum IGH-CR14 TaxID=580059 RepID=A0A0L1IBT7_PLAFA|nr:serine/threonine protein kinase [Plasmodium falciparum IGH-CR14]
MGNTLYSNIGHSTTELDDVYCKYLNKLFNIYNYLFKYEHFFFMNSYTLNNFYHVLEGINNNEGHVLIKICKLKSEAPKIKRILYTLKFLFSFDLFPNVLPYNRMSVYENNIYIYRRFIFKNLDHYLSNKINTNNFYYFYIFQIFLSIIQLHSLGIYHGHIKRENVLIQNNMHIFLTDINILNDYLYFIPKIRYEDERKGRLMKLQEDIFNLGILILEILLRDKDVSYFFLNENCAYKNDDNFYSGRRKQSGLTFLKKMESIDEDDKNDVENYHHDSNDYHHNENYYNMNQHYDYHSDNYYKCNRSNYKEEYTNDENKKNGEYQKKYVHALSLPSIKKKKKQIKNEEYPYFNKNQNIKMNIDKYKYYNYHYINNVNYINIYNDIYNNVSPFSSIDYNGENIFYENDSNFFKRQPIKYSNTHNIKEQLNDDFQENIKYNDKNIYRQKQNEQVTQKKSQGINIYNVTDLFEDNKDDKYNTGGGDENDNHGNKNDNRGNKNDNDGEKNYNDGEKNYNDGEKNYNDGEKNYNDGDKNNISNNADIYYNNLHNSNYYNNVYTKKTPNKIKKNDHKDPHMVPYKIWKVVNQEQDKYILLNMLNRRNNKSGYVSTGKGSDTAKEKSDNEDEDEDDNNNNNNYNNNNNNNN